MINVNLFEFVPKIVKVDQVALKHKELPLLNQARPSLTTLAADRFVHSDISCLVGPQ